MKHFLSQHTVIFFLVCLYFIKVCLNLWSNQPTKPSSLVCLLTALEIPLPLQQPNLSCVKLASASFSIIWSFSGSVQSNYRPILLLQEMLPPPFLQCIKQCWVVWGVLFQYLQILVAVIRGENQNKINHYINAMSIGGTLQRGGQMHSFSEEMPLLLKVQGPVFSQQRCSYRS